MVGGWDEGVGVCWCLLVFVGVCWCLLVSVGVHSVLFVISLISIAIWRYIIGQLLDLEMGQ